MSATLTGTLLLSQLKNKLKNWLKRVVSKRPKNLLPCRVLNPLGSPTRFLTRSHDPLRGEELRLVRKAMRGEGNSPKTRHLPPMQHARTRGCGKQSQGIQGTERKAGSSRTTEHESRVTGCGRLATAKKRRGIRHGSGRRRMEPPSLPPKECQARRRFRQVPESWRPASRGLGVARGPRRRPAASHAGKLGRKGWMAGRVVPCEVHRILVGTAIERGACGRLSAGRAETW